ncbi:MAG: DUF805 domain-containing protein [Pseudolysinimonas sp.]
MTIAPTSASLDLPLHGASFGQAVSRFWKKYATFSGRASRSEYWFAVIFVVLVLVVIWVPGFIIGLATGTPGVDSYGRAATTPGPAFIPFAIVGGLFYLAVLVPGIAIQVRRLHDANLSGGFWFLHLIPSIGGIIVLVLTVLESNPLGARFDKGAAPVAGPPAA